MFDGTAGRIAVVGGGGIGGTIAASLTLAGEDVTLIDESREHLEAIRDAGLRFDTPAGTQVVTIPRVLHPAELTEPVDLVLVAVKSQDTADAIETIAPWLQTNSVVVSLQNGWNARTIAARVGENRTMAAMVHLVAFRSEPGHVTRYTRGDFYVGELDNTCSERAVRLAELLSAVAPTHATENVWGYIWSKQIYGSTMPINALVDQPASETYAHDWVKNLLLGVMLEGIQVADAEGVKLEAYERFDPTVMRVVSKDGLAAAIAALPKGSSKGNSSDYFDLKNHQKTEIEHLGGELVRRGRRHGLPMTLLSEVVEMILEIEAGKRAMGMQNIQRLREPAARFVSDVVATGVLSPRTSIRSGQ